MGIGGSGISRYQYPTLLNVGKGLEDDDDGDVIRNTRYVLRNKIHSIVLYIVEMCVCV